MKPTVKLTKKSNLPSVEKQLKQLARSEVFVGIPQAANARPDGEISNAELMFLLTNGSPLNNIPATPILEAAIAKPKTKSLIGKELGAAAADVLAKNPQGAREHLERAGMIGANASKSIFTESDNGWPPNAPSTIARKGSDRRNIDTSELRRAITWIVNETK
jgi:hypothetical protein